MDLEGTDIAGCQASHVPLCAVPDTGKAMGETSHFHGLFRNRLLLFEASGQNQNWMFRGADMLNAGIDVMQQKYNLSSLFCFSYSQNHIFSSPTDSCCKVWWTHCTLGSQVFYFPIKQSSVCHKTIVEVQLSKKGLLLNLLNALILVPGWKPLRSNSLLIHCESDQRFM